MTKQFIADISMAQTIAIYNAKRSGKKASWLSTNAFILAMQRKQALLLATRDLMECW